MAVAGKTIELQSAISIGRGISISGKNASVILSGRNQNGIFSGGKSIDGLTFINAKTAISGSSLIFDCTFKDNIGGAISGSSSVTNCTFRDIK